jgi:hypothetical protein
MTSSWTDEEVYDEFYESGSSLVSQIDPVEEYNDAMKRAGWDLEYHHSLGMNYTEVLPELLLGSCLQTPADVQVLARQLVGWRRSLLLFCHLELFSSFSGEVDRGAPRTASGVGVTNASRLFSTNKLAAFGSSSFCWLFFLGFATIARAECCPPFGLRSNDLDVLARKIGKYLLNRQPMLITRFQRLPSFEGAPSSPTQRH